VIGKKAKRERKRKIIKMRKMLLMNPKIQKKSKRNPPKRRSRPTGFGKKKGKIP